MIKLIKEAILPSLKLFENRDITSITWQEIGTIKMPGWELCLQAPLNRSLT
jgi:hypothetical protein